jgi:hypothetical protein
VNQFYSWYTVIKLSIHNIYGSEKCNHSLYNNNNNNNTTTTTNNNNNNNNDNSIFYSQMFTVYTVFTLCFAAFVNDVQVLSCNVNLWHVHQMSPSRGQHSYLGGPGFKFWPKEANLLAFGGFPHSPIQIPGFHLKLHRSRQLFSLRLHFVFTNNHTIRRYKVWATSSIIWMHQK